MTGLVGEPAEAGPDFARLWERQDGEAAPTLTKAFRHPAAGEVTVACDALGLADRDQHRAPFSAPPGSSAPMASPC
ncbi:MmyB family transcriptional regulator [Streptomyces mexicanus]|uniref:MmyB family transcriptional regulator n=1 Tax=Streptomyces mexicanus TaxID=178566 RepID=UPI003658E6B4